MEILSAIYVALYTILAYVTLLFCIALIFKRNDIADIGWGVGILLVGVSAYIKLESPPPFFLLIMALVSVWAFRLSVRILLRNIKKSEDTRYKRWRDTWGKSFYIRSFFQIYILQGMLMILVGYPLLHTAVFGGGVHLDIWTYIGVTLWCIGFFFEVVGDYQLDNFLRNRENKGKLMRTGLWKYSRHPNYFGEVLMWWGVWGITLAVPYGVFAIISPLVITFLILKVSGIPMLEKNMEKHPDFTDYKMKTSVFFPLPERN